jgi:hypothetical protein
MPKKSLKPGVKKIVKKEVVAEVKKDLAKNTSPIRQNSKMLQLIEMIKAAEDGITLKQISENLKWQPHTTRSAISRLNKNQNVGIINDKIADGNRVYKFPKKD